MSLLTHLTNVATTTKLPEGNLEALQARITKITADMTDIEKDKLEKQVLDSFTSVSVLLDQIELDRAQTTVNRLRVNSAGKRPNPQTRGYLPPKSAA